MCREFMRGACKRAESECRFAHPQESVSSHEDGSVTVCIDAVKGRCAREPCRYFHPPLHLQAQIKAAQTRATAVWLYYFNPLPKKKITEKKLRKSTNKKWQFSVVFFCSNSCVFLNPGVLFCRFCLIFLWQNAVCLKIHNALYVRFRNMHWLTVIVFFLDSALKNNHKILNKDRIDRVWKPILTMFFLPKRFVFQLARLCFGC